MDTAQLTWLDRAITWLAPSLGFRREQARLQTSALRAANNVLLSYDGAKVGRRTEGWITTGADSNTEISVALPYLRNRSSDLIRNHSSARRVKSVVTTSTVGTGIIPQANTGDKALNQIIDDAFWTWQAQCNADCSNDGRSMMDLFGLQKQWVGAIFERGACLVRRRIRRPEDNLFVPLKLQSMECDHIDLSQTTNTYGGYTVNGVAFDEIGQRAGYYLFDVHPGASYSSLSYRQGLASRLIPASEIIHCFRASDDRPGQVHGVPWLSPAMLLFRDMEEYNEAEIVRAKIAACLSLFVSNPTGGSLPSAGTLGSTTAESGTGQLIEKMRPGMILYGKPGQAATPIVPTGHSNFTDFMRFEQHLLAVACDLHYTQISGDLTAVNYSSYRAGDRDFRGAIEAFRWLCVIPGICDPVWRWFIDAAYLAGRIPERNYGVTWTPPQFLSVDPVKDALAAELELSNGGLTWPEYVAQKGYDPSKQLASILDWAKRFDEAGQVFAFDRRRVTASGALQTAVAEAASTAPPVKQ